VRGRAARFRSSQIRGNVLVGSLILNVAASLAIIASTVAETAVLKDYPGGAVIPGGDVAEAIDRSVLLSRIGLGIYVVSGIAWLVWQHRAQANLHALRIPSLQYSPRWAVGWWLIPFANLFKPFQTVRELWKASGPSSGWPSGRTWAVIGWWWAGWIAGIAIARIALSVLRGSPDTLGSFDPLISGNRWLVVGEIVTVVTAVLAILIVRSVIDRQSALAAVVDAEPVPPRPDSPGSGT
jgi:hypothetical protein